MNGSVASGRTETVVTLRQLTPEEKLRQLEYYREKRLHDEASALGAARREGIAEGIAEVRARVAANLHQSGYPEEDIEKILATADEGTRDTADSERTETVVTLRQLTPVEKLKQLEYYREKRLHDEASALGGARREGYAEGKNDGIVEGRAEGRAEGITIGEGKVNARVAARLRRIGFSEEDIEDILAEETQE